MQRFSVESCHAWLQHVRRSRRPRRPPLWSSPVADLCRCVRVCVRACAWACACSTRQEGTLVFHCAVRFLLLRCGLGRSRARLLGLGRLVLRQRATLAQPSLAAASQALANASAAAAHTEAPVRIRSKEPSRSAHAFVGESAVQTALRLVGITSRCGPQAAREHTCRPYVVFSVRSAPDLRPPTYCSHQYRFVPWAVRHSIA
jgi:hypothetical protein